MEKIKCKKALVILALTLTGCGSKEDETDSSASIPNTPIAYDILAITQVNKPRTLDLSENIDSQTMTIADIYTETPERCFAYVDSIHSVNVEMSNTDTCQYTYVAKDNLGKAAQAKLTLIASENANSVLPSINKAELTDTKINIDLQSYFGDEIEGYSIVNDEDSPSIEFERGAEQITDLEAEDNTLTFTTPKGIGWHLIRYKLAKASSIDKYGELFVSVTDTINQAPSINPINYEHLITIKTNTEYEIDLSTLTGLTIGEENDEDWQLTKVLAMAARVAPTYPETIGNKVFTFETSDAGVHDVTYIISNYYGASRTGMISIKALLAY